jgi:NADPH-dependent glutamate synthase beta subunit-like oxidoreductase
MTVGNKVRKKKMILPQVHGEKCWPLVEKISPCEEACPIHMDIPSYVIALSQGKIREAIDIVRQTNPFPSICGRVCHHPCEEACTRALVDKPIAIEWLKRFIAQSEQSNGNPRPRLKHKKEERVAVIGSGPAGLTAAHDLALKGYGVVVFEALPVAGGMLAAGIPDFNLPKNVVKYEVDYIKGLGVEIRTNMRIGKNLSFQEIWDQGYKAVLLASGAWKSVELKIPGVDLKGVFQALPFLREVKLGEKTFLKGKVVVIGGGNVAVDAARTALRLGSEEVTLACLESRPEMPAFSWEIEKAEGEGVKILNSLASQKIIPKTLGKVKEVAFTRIARLTRDQDGKLSWNLATGPENDVILAADSVIIAIGQAPDPSFVQEVALAGNKTFQVDADTMATNVPGIFAAGDAVRMPGTIVEAIAAGHLAAKSINHYLKGKPLKKEKKKKNKEVFRLDEKAVLPSFLVKKDRWDMPSLSKRDAMRTFGETAIGYTQEQVMEEAKRCLNCRMCGNCIFERGQLCFETSTRLL